MNAPANTLNAYVQAPFPPIPGAAEGPLAGLTFAVKDIYNVRGQRTGGGNPQKLDEAAPAASTAPAVQKLLDAGATLVARAQTDELTFSLMGQNAHYPFPVNPAAPGRVTGGSSSGSASAVAAGLVDFATGSDTGGSVRAPASFCGLLGLRGTHGAISLDGAMPLAPSFDTFGWFAKDGETYERVAKALLPAASGNSSYRALRLSALDGLLLGEAEAAEYARIAAQVAEVIGEASEAAPLSQSIDDLYWTFRKLQSYEAWAMHGPWISAKERHLGPGVKERFEFGSTISSEAAGAETEKRDALRSELALMLGNDGLLVLPTVPGAAPLSDIGFDALQDYRERALRLLCLSGLSGFPQITIPLGTVDGAPFGISLLGPAGSDMALIGLARTILEHAKGSR